MVLLPLQSELRTIRKGLKTDQVGPWEFVEATASRTQGAGDSLHGFSWIIQDEKDLEALKKIYPLVIKHKGQFTFEEYPDENTPLMPPKM